MTLRTRVLVLVAVAGVGIALAGAVRSGSAQRPPAELARLYAYDANAPLAVREARRTTWLGARLVELSYASPRGGRVPASLVLPPAKRAARPAPVPAVLIQHGAGGSRVDFLGEAADLARRGLAVFLIDAPMNRPPFPEWASFTTRDRATYVQNVVDWRRAIDVLAARPDIDAQRLAFVGHSYGATIAGIMAAVESRLDGVVVMSGGARLTDFLRRVGSQRVNNLPRAQRARARAALRRYLAHMATVDGVRYVPFTTAPLLFQFGRRDAIVPAREARAYYEAARGEKRIEWYEAGHELDEKARASRAAWLGKVLRIG